MYPTKQSHSRLSRRSPVLNQRLVRAFIGISLRSFGHRIQFQIALRRDAECVCDAIKECEHCRDVYSLRNLRLSPSMGP
jgi:hypothetical protein